MHRHHSCPGNDPKRLKLNLFSSPHFSHHTRRDEISRLLRVGKSSESREPFERINPAGEMGNFPSHSLGIYVIPDGAGAGSGHSKPVLNDRNGDHLRQNIASAGKRQTTDIEQILSILPSPALVTDIWGKLIYVLGKLVQQCQERVYYCKRRWKWVKEKFSFAYWH